MGQKVTRVRSRNSGNEDAGERLVGRREETEGDRKRRGERTSSTVDRSAVDLSGRRATPGADAGAASAGAGSGYVGYEPGPDRDALSARYGMEVQSGQARKLQRLETEFGQQRVQRWADEGMSVETMGKPRDMEAFRQQTGDASGEMPADTEQHNRASRRRNRNAERDGGPAGAAGVPDEVRRVVSASGRSMDESVQREMESKMGDEGKKVLAHELTHVRQGTGGQVSLLPQPDADHPSSGETPGSVHIQPKLEVSSPDDPAEQEAEQVAEQVVGMDAETDDDEDGADRTSTEAGRLADPVSRSSGGGSVPVETESAVRSGVQGEGKPLPSGTRTAFESKLGADLSGVRVHTDSTADEAATSINAEAYTLGSDIAFSSGTYNPDSQGGQKLLAHELTHVVQQGGRGSSRSARQTRRVHRFLGSVASGIKGAAESVAEAGQSAVEGATQAFEAVAGGAKEAGSQIWDVLERSGQSAWEAVQNAGQTAWDVLRSGGQRLWDTLQHNTELLARMLQEGGRQAWQLLKDGGARAWTVIQSAGSQAWSVLRSAPGRLLDLLRSNTQLLVRMLREGGKQALEALKRCGRQVWDLIQNAGRRVRSVLQGMEQWLWELLDSAVGFVSSAKELIAYLVDRIKDIIAGISPRGGEPSGTFLPLHVASLLLPEYVPSLLSSYATIAKLTIKDKIPDSVAEFAAMIADKIPGPVKWLLSAAGNVVGAVTTRILGWASSAYDALPKSICDLSGESRLSGVAVRALNGAVGLFSGYDGPDVGVEYACSQPKHKRISNTIEETYGSSWSDSLPACPVRVPVDAGAHEGFENRTGPQTSEFHPGARRDFRVAAGGDGPVHGQQCCYGVPNCVDDEEEERLQYYAIITQENYDQFKGGTNEKTPGTPDVWSPKGVKGTLGHQLVDVMPASEAPSWYATNGAWRCNAQVSGHPKYDPSDPCLSLEDPEKEGDGDEGEKGDEGEGEGGDRDEEAEWIRHDVERGDSLWALAEQYNVADSPKEGWKRIAEWNDIDPERYQAVVNRGSVHPEDTIYPGDVLRIKKTGKTGSTAGRARAD